MEWISVNDKLPNHKQPIIVFINVNKSQNLQQKFIMKSLKHCMGKVDFGYAYIEQYEGGVFLSGYTKTENHHTMIYPHGDDYITHWMPLPEPPG